VTSPIKNLTAHETAAAGLSWTEKPRSAKRLTRRWGLRVGSPPIKVSGSELLIECAVFEHVIGRREDRGGNRADCLLRPASSAQPHELRVEVGGLSARSGPGALNDRGLQPGGTHTQAGRAALAGAFLVARAQAGPGARRCAAVANRLMSVPISDRMTWALSSLTPGIVLSCLTASRKEARALYRPPDQSRRCRHRARRSAADGDRAGSDGVA